MSLFCVAHKYIILGLTSWYWITNEGAYPWVTRIHSLSSCQLPKALYLGESIWVFPPSTLACQLALSLIRSCLGSPIIEISWVSFPSHTKHNTILLQTIWYSGFYNLFVSCPPPCCSQILRYRGYIVDTSIRIRHPQLVCIHLIVGFCNCLCLLQQRKGFDEGEIYISLWVED